MQAVGQARSPVEAAAPAGLTPLIGRDQEVGMLKDRWKPQEGMGPAVLLIGEPGLGNSRGNCVPNQPPAALATTGFTDALKSGPPLALGERCVETYALL